MKLPGPAWSRRLRTPTLGLCPFGAILLLVWGATQLPGAAADQPVGQGGTPSPVAPEPAKAPGLLFGGDELGDFVDQSAPGAVTQAADPTGEGRVAFKLTVGDDDVYPLTPTDNPRAQLLSPAIFTPGSEFWWRSSFYLPAEFPSSVPGWLTVLEGPYGPPYDGSPPWHIEVNGERLRWQRNGTYDWDIPWEMPLVKNQWVEVLLHARFGTDGWVEMWVDGEPITFFQDSTDNPNHVPPTTRLAMQTMDASNDGGPNFSVIQSYREAGMFGTVSLYQGPLLLGETRTSVEG